MRITVEDCLKLDIFKNSKIVSCGRKSKRRVRTISVLDEVNLEMGVERNGIKEQLVITHFWTCSDDIETQCKVVSGLGKKGIAALVIFLNDEGVTELDQKVVKTADESGLLIITVKDDNTTTYAMVMEEVMDKILYGNNYSDNILNNTIYHLLNFEKNNSFPSALKEAAISNDYQTILMTVEFNPILTVETRHKKTIDDAIRLAKKKDVSHSSMFTLVNVEGIYTYWGPININGVKHLLMIVDNEDNYSATEMKKLAEIIELAIGMWKYTPERDSKSEFIKSAIRGNLSLCHALLEEAGLRDKTFMSVFYASGIDNSECQDIIDNFKINSKFNLVQLEEENEFYGIIYIDAKEEKGPMRKAECLKLFEKLKEGRKDVRIFHSTGIDNLDDAIEGFKMINETWNYVESVFPYKRVFTKYEMSMVWNCINLQMQGTNLRKMYLDLLEPFGREVTHNKGKQLLDTLETFVLDAGMNSNKTAEFMDIHNNTVQYRLKRINEILGADMSGNRVIPGLTMALALRRLEDQEGY